MQTISFADVVHKSITFSPQIESDALVLELIDNPWIQRLREISQTANTRLVYMFSEHSRFGHSLGVAYLASQLLEKLSHTYAEEISNYRNAVAAAALLHDIGHLAPGSHVSYKTWFPKVPDAHEAVTVRIIKEDPGLNKIFANYGTELISTVCEILEESERLPAWTWEIISGGGWNVDRGNWSIVDSIMAGVSYGRYNIPALTDSIVLTPDKHLALSETRLDAMMHFALSRHAMYRQVYQHRVLRSADTLNRAIVQRARDLGEKLDFADNEMQAVLKSESPHELSLDTIFRMRESWWQYHIMRWTSSQDKILSDLSDRLINRRLLKTVRVLDQERKEDLWNKAKQALHDSGFDPRYYLHEISTSDMQEHELTRSMLVMMEDGGIETLAEAEPLFAALIKESAGSRRTWLAMPQEAKLKLGRKR